MHTNLKAKTRGTGTGKESIHSLICRHYQIISCILLSFWLQNDNNTFHFEIRDISSQNLLLTFIVMDFANVMHSNAKMDFAQLSTQCKEAEKLYMLLITQ